MHPDPAAGAGTPAAQAMEAWLAKEAAIRDLSQVTLDLHCAQVNDTLRTIAGQAGVQGVSGPLLSSSGDSSVARLTRLQV